jgi:hypothetical protein
MSKDDPLLSGEYVVIITGEDDVADGQLARVISPNDEPNWAYDPDDNVRVACWTGYELYTPANNLIRVRVDGCDDSRMAKLFESGRSRTGTMEIQF